jgi:predicted DNA-binding transcriptional regulator YafY
MADGAAGGSRVVRLDSLKALLAERDVTTTADLAAELGVSVRTVARDLAVLRDMGMPIEGDRGRGGGVRLEPGWYLGRVHLNESEALGLLLSRAIAEKVGSPLLSAT